MGYAATRLRLRLRRGRIPVKTMSMSSEGRSIVNPANSLDWKSPFPDAVTFDHYQALDKFCLTHRLEQLLELALHPLMTELPTPDQDHRRVLRTERRQQPRLIEVCRNYNSSFI